MRNPCDGATAPKATRPELTVWTPEQRRRVPARHARASGARPLCAGADDRYAARRIARVEMGDIDCRRRDARGTARLAVAARDRDSCSGAQDGAVTAQASTSARRALRRPAPHKDRQRSSAHAAVSAWTDTRLVFCDAMGDPLSPTNETKRFQRAAAAGGVAPHPLPRLAPHRGDDPARQGRTRQARLARCSGTPRSRLTLDTYSHVIPANAQRCGGGDGCGVQRVTRSFAVSFAVNHRERRERCSRRSIFRA